MTQRVPPNLSQYSQELQAEVSRLTRQEKHLASEMGSKWDRKKARIMRSIPAANDKEKDQIFKEQTHNYFKINFSIDLQGFFAQKPNIHMLPNIVYEEEALVVYGVDFLTHTRLYNYFRYFLPTKIQWINDSSCKVTFKYCSGAKRAIRENLLPNTGFVSKIQNGMWYSLKPYFVLGFQRPLEARIATSYDICVTEIQNSKFSVYEKARIKYMEAVNTMCKKQTQYPQSNTITLSNKGQYKMSTYQVPKEIENLELYNRTPITHMEEQHSQEPFVSNLTSIFEKFNIRQDNNQVNDDKFAGQGPLYNNESQNQIIEFLNNFDKSQTKPSSKSSVLTFRFEDE